MIPGRPTWKRQRCSEARRLEMDMPLVVRRIRRIAIRSGWTRGPRGRGRPAERRRLPRDRGNRRLEGGAGGGGEARVEGGGGGREGGGRGGGGCARAVGRRGGGGGGVGGAADGAYGEGRSQDPERPPPRTLRTIGVRHRQMGDLRNLR